MPDDKSTRLDDIDADVEDIEIEFVDTDAESPDHDLPPAVTSEDPADTLRAENQRLRSEIDQLREIYLRKLAEFDNFRKRTDREHEELKRTAAEIVVRDLVPVLDNFERAMQHGPEGDTVSFRAGVEMIARQLWDVLERQGLEAIDPTGQPFQPEYHEAVQRIEDGRHKPGTIVWVLAKGYLFAGKLLRPAMVGVAVDPPENTESRIGPNNGEGANS